MRLTSVFRIFTSHQFYRPSGLKATTYHNRGKPTGVLRDDGSNYLAERNITPKTQDYRHKLERLDRLEQAQLNNCPPLEI